MGREGAMRRVGEGQRDNGEVAARLPGHDKSTNVGENGREARSKEDEDEARSKEDNEGANHEKTARKRIVDLLWKFTRSPVPPCIYSTLIAPGLPRNSSYDIYNSVAAVIRSP